MSILAGLITLYGHERVERLHDPVQMFDAVGLGLFARGQRCRQGSAHARVLVGAWADRIADAITEHLIAELGRAMAPAAAAAALVGEPGGHDWDDFQER